MLRSMPLKFVATKTRGSTLRVPAWRARLL